jgi:hypothetical protein
MECIQIAIQFIVGKNKKYMKFLIQTKLSLKSKKLKNLKTIQVSNLIRLLEELDIKNKLEAC